MVMNLKSRIIGLTLVLHPPGCLSQNLILISHAYPGFVVHWSRDNYRKVFNIRRTLIDNEIIDHSDVVGASPVGAAPTTSSFST